MRQFYFGYQAGHWLRKKPFNVPVRSPWSEVRALWSSLKSNIAAGYVLIAVVALLAIGAIGVIGQFLMIRSAMLHSMQAHAAFIHEDIAAATSAQHINDDLLHPARLIPNLLSASIFLSDGSRLADFKRADAALAPYPDAALRSKGYEYTWRHIKVEKPFFENQRLQGYIVIVEDLSPAYEGVVRYLCVIAFGTIGALIVTGPIVAKLRRRVVSATDRLKYLAYRDPLTGLENERAFRESLERILSETVVRDDILAVLHLEVDNVKAVSDVRGQHVGKELLNAIARRLSEVVEAKHGQIFRTGNNEFAIITTALESRHQVRDLSRKILAKFSRSIALSQDDVVVTVSIGSSVFPDDGSRADAISANADIAMSVARRSGRHLFREYKPEMGLATRQRLNLETDLRKALARAQLEVYYQPQIDSLTQRVIGAEALLRWRHPQHGMIAPLDFIPIAEETGLIIEIGKWVLQEACREALHWERNGFGALRMSVNVSARQIGSPSFTQDIFDILKQNNFPPDRLELELTESELMHDIDAGIAFMQAVRAQGVGISLDDFGTGYSSLSYLSSFPLDRLKIDRSFVKDLPAQGCAMAKAVISLARSFDLEIVAEGVEEFEQFAWLKEMGCGIIQGFLFARPMDASTVRRFLSGHAASQ